MACFPSNSGFRPKRPEERDMTSGTWPPRASDFPSPPPISTKREQLAPEATRAGAGRLQDWAGEDPDRTCAGRGERSWRALPSATGRQHQGIAWVIVDGPRVVSSRQPPLRNGRRSGPPATPFPDPSVSRLPRKEALTLKTLWRPCQPRTFGAWRKGRQAPHGRGEWPFSRSLPRRETSNQSRRTTSIGPSHFSNSEALCAKNVSVPRSLQSAAIERTGHAHPRAVRNA